MPHPGRRFQLPGDYGQPPSDPSADVTSPRPRAVDPQAVPASRFDERLGTAPAPVAPRQPVGRTSGPRSSVGRPGQGSSAASPEGSPRRSRAARLAVPVAAACAGLVVGAIAAPWLPDLGELTVLSDLPGLP